VLHTFSQSCLPTPSPIRLAGNRTQMGSEATYSLLQTTAPSSCPLRVHPGSCGQEAGPPLREINSMTISSLAAAVHALAGHGHQSATVIAGTTNVTKIAWKDH